VAEFVLPGAADRTVVIGQTGSGKTILAAWLLSQQRFDKRPWVALDFKGEELWDRVGDPPMRPLKLGQMPGKRGLYRMDVHPGQEDELEAWFWKIWERGNVGLFVDEVSLVPQKHAFKAILRQGRSKLIPVIACTQRPVDCDREVFTESQYRAFFGLEDIRDYQVIRGLFGNQDIRDELPKLKRHWSLWYDVRQKSLTVLKAAPPPATVASELRQVVPYGWFLGG
jgi:DNA helicase HerA-like ATPase